MRILVTGGEGQFTYNRMVQPDPATGTGEKLRGMLF